MRGHSSDGMLTSQSEDSGFDTSADYPDFSPEFSAVSWGKCRYGTCPGRLLLASFPHPYPDLSHACTKAINKRNSIKLTTECTIKINWLLITKHVTVFVSSTHTHSVPANSAWDTNIRQRFGVHNTWKLKLNYGLADNKSVESVDFQVYVLKCIFSFLFLP